MTDHPIGVLIKAMDLAGRLERSKYHLTLGKLINVLEKVPADTFVKFVYPDGRQTFPGEEFSYRGYYDDLALEPTQLPKKAGELLVQMKYALGRTYEGYKGGDFVMDEKTPLWCGCWGEWSGTYAIISTTTMNGGLCLILKPNEDN